MALTLLENSYLEDAEAYLADNPYWVSATAAEQEQALVDATRVLDQNPWAGTAVSSSQPLGWPRTKLSFFDPVLSLYVPCEQGEIPIRLQKATAYLALHFIKYPEVVRGYDVTYDEITLGPISLVNSDSSGSSSPKVPLVPMEVRTLIAPLLQQTATAGWWRSN